jgi:Ca2+-transporting ATPase
MGARGTDVARESAALVITDDDFASIAGGIRQGRGIFENLRKAMAYVLAVHVPIFGMSLLPVFVADWPLVLLPVQIAFLELIIDPACSVVFQSEQIDPKIMDRPPRGLGEAMFDRPTLTVAALQGVSALAAVVAVYLWSVLSDRPDEVVRSITFTALVVGNLALILVNRSWRLSVWQSFRQRRNRTLKWILGGAVAALVLLLGVPPLRDAFNFGAMTIGQAVAGVAAGLAGVAWFEMYKALAGGHSRTGSRSAS